MRQAVVLSALAEARVSPASHGCLETHGTGTALGDPMEVGALQTALANGREQPLQLGAAKTNVGHLEGGAGTMRACHAVLDENSSYSSPSIGSFMLRMA